jgi:hypothetical protein
MCPGPSLRPMEFPAALGSAAKHIENHLRRTGGNVLDQLLAAGVFCCLSGTHLIDGWGTKVEASKLPKNTMRAAVGLAVIAALLVMMSPLIIGNFGTATFSVDAPVAILVTMICLLAPVVCVLFSAVLVAASLIMRHAEALKTGSLAGR